MNGKASLSPVRAHSGHHVCDDPYDSSDCITPSVSAAATDLPIDVRRPTSAHASAGTIISVWSVCDSGRIGSVTITSKVETTEAIAHVVAPSRSGDHPA